MLVVLPVGWLAASQVGQVGWEQRPGIAVLLGIFVALAAAGIASWAVAAPRFGKTRKVSAEMRSTVIFGAAPLVRLTAPWLIAPVGLLLAASQIPVPSFGGTSRAMTDTGIWEPRYLLFCTPALALLTVGMTSRLPRRTMAMAIAALVALAFAGQALIRPRISTDDIRAVSAVLQSEARRGDDIIFPSIAKRLIKDAYPRGFERLRDIGLATSPAHRDSLYGLNVSNSVLWRRLAGTDRLWVVIFPVTRPARYYGHPGARHDFCLQRTWRFRLNMILLYDRCGLNPPIQRGASGATFSHALEMTIELASS
jgi:mannosyltransferase